jgi:meso-butanediol dehydrogenase/(S,S)-butanediol dehydrogenase/diacetyl reductase
VREEIEVELEGCVAIVTGGARGIGRGIATELARAGCDVAIGDLLALPEIAADAEETISGIEALGRRAIAVACDVTVQSECDGLVDSARAQLGGLDVVVCNAGIMQIGGVADITSEQWRRVLDVNLTGAFQTCKAALPHLVEQGRGAIVNVASTTGLRAGTGRVAYSASKFGVVGLTESLAGEVARQGVRVNCVCPAFTRSNMSITELMEQTGIEDFSQADALWTKVGHKRLPLGRSVEPEDIGRAVVWLAQSDMVVGVALPVTGGEGLPAA